MQPDFCLTKLLNPSMERAWIRSFGPMRILQVDEHRSWASDHFKTWAGNHSIQLMISPGQAHERLAVIERRHQVIRRAVALFLLESKEYGPEGIINALNYVIPQVNRLPNMQGDSPLQWTLGYNPHVPGLLMEEELNPTQLHPTEAFRTSTLFRQELVNSQKPGPKIFWKGPATVVMVEHEPHEVLWLVHGTTMLRAAPEHVKPVISPDPSTSTITIEQPLQRAQLNFLSNKFATVESPSTSTPEVQTKEPEKKWRQRMRWTTPTQFHLLNQAVWALTLGTFLQTDKPGNGSIEDPEPTSTSQWLPTKLRCTCLRPLGQLTLAAQRHFTIHQQANR